jgi:5'-methylthioinosine phosphorylase
VTLIAIIGGSGLTDLEDLQLSRQQAVRTPYGEPSAPMTFGQLAGREVVFLPRHGPAHSIAPHAINYRANVWALKQVGASYVIAVNAVGAIRTGLPVASLVFPHQIIDYTWGREHTFCGGGEVRHVDFSEPYCERLRQILIRAAADARIRTTELAIYAATQGPRFESVAEIRRCERDGCDVVGMTGMPEAGLARELGLCYACVAVVVNPAAGKAPGEIKLQGVQENLVLGMTQARALLRKAIPLIS